MDFKQTILVVDDTSAICRLVKGLLETAGYAVLIAGNAATAMMLYEQHRGAVGLVLTDVLMPEKGGLDLVDRILRLEPEQPVLLMSGTAQNIRGGLDCLAKPFSRAELLGRVGAVLKGTRQTRRQIGALAG